MKHNINSQNTKTILADTFLSLLQKKNISKITISEIVNLCEINRKTFYYHFTDVYDLFEWYLNNEVQKAIEATDLNDLNSTITYSINYMHTHTYLCNCIDSPIGRDKVVQILNKHIQPKAAEMIRNLELQYKKSIEPDFKEFLIKSMTHITILSVLDAIENPDGYDAEKIKLYLSDIFTASVNGFFHKL